MNNVTGYNPSVVINALNHIQEAYNALIRAIGHRMQNEIVNGMADIWASKNAQEHFARYQENNNQILQGSDNTFANIFASMNSAASAWAAVSHESFDTVSFTADPKRIDVSNIADNKNGERGMVVESAPEVIGKLPGIREDAASALSNAVATVQNCGFLDAFGAQKASLVESLNSIKKTIDDFVGNMTATMNAELNAAKEETEETKARIAQAFAGAK